MRIIVVSCAKYSDAWGPFVAFFQKFWPQCAAQLWLVTDDVPLDAGFDYIYLSNEPTWNRILAQFCLDYPDEPILLFQEDFFLTAPVREPLIHHGLELFHQMHAGCVRLYPCPGSDGEIDDPYFGLVSRYAPYRISTQAAIWDPAYLHRIAAQTKTPWEFELIGSKIAGLEPQPIYAFRRDVTPWPIEYICTAIVRGVWQHDAIEWCRKNNVPIDTSRRAVQEDVCLL